MSKRLKSAAAYRRGDKIFMHADSMTKDGVWILSKPVLACDTKNMARLGQGIADVLSGSRQGVHHPRSWKGLTTPLLEIAGAKSWNAFAKSAKCVNISCENDYLTYVPTRNEGPSGGFVPLNEKSHRLSSAVPEQMGSALLEVFDECE